MTTDTYTLLGEIFFSAIIAGGLFLGMLFTIAVVANIITERKK